MKKDKLYNYCLSYVQESISNFEKAIHNAQAAANEEGKSSAGDKYETGRSMMQLEIEKNVAQLAHSKQMLQILEKVKEIKITDFITQGSLVTTNHGIYYLTIGIGVVKIENDTFYVISQDSPIGLLLKGKKLNESFSFNGRNFTIEKIE